MVRRVRLPAGRLPRDYASSAFFATTSNRVSRREYLECDRGGRHRQSRGGGQNLVTLAGQHVEAGIEIAAALTPTRRYPGACYHRCQEHSMRIRRGAERPGHTRRAPRCRSGPGAGLSASATPSCRSCRSAPRSPCTTWCGAPALETVDGPERDRRFGWSIGVDTRTPIKELYPSLGVGSDDATAHTISPGGTSRRAALPADAYDQRSRRVHEVGRGSDVDLCLAVVVAVTLGYRVLFVEPYEGSVVVGLSVVMRPAPATTDRE